MYLNLCSDFFGHAGKLLDEKAKVNFKIFDITSWETNNYNIHNAEYLKTQRESENEIWSVKRIQDEKHFA